MQSYNPTMEVYNDLQQFKQFFSSLITEDRSDIQPVEADFDLNDFVDESWAD